MAYHLANTREVHGFGQRLRAWRDGNEFDLDAAAGLLGVSGNDLHTIERGVYPPPAPLLDRFEEVVRSLSFFTAPEITRRVPVVSWVQAGRFARYEEMLQDWVSWIDCLCPDPNAFAVRVDGDSMLPNYAPGDLAICMPGFPPKNHALVVAKTTDGLVTFKNVIFRGERPERFRFVPLNPEFDSVVVRRQDLAWIYPVCAVVSPGRRTQG